MTSPNASLIAIWEDNSDGYSVTESAISILQTFTDVKNPESLPIGERDKLVMNVRKKIFGAGLKALDRCPSCGVELIFEINLNDLSFESNHSVFLCELDGFKAMFRLITSQDILNSASFEPEKRREEVLRACFISGECGGKKLEFDDLPPELLLQAEQLMEEKDTSSLIKVNQICVSCGKSKSGVLDVTSIFLEDTDTYVQKYLERVCELTKLSGWTETEITNMSEKKRRYYLEKLNA